ncbi:hypothetical protein GCM10011609_66280 [Lentzea pudingi]|uniref:Lipoprotein n=1 Tax=Lentzea pudingi TaxID=1789439 RepID=A0ABQ2IQW2_9PSEU|nr:hypothetical protein [Lentzea pudingi]GGN16252.1 hypothetical protein GCM10011609_66280 [Lentzea pudingi]
MRLALTLLLVLSACSAAPADPVALVKGWTSQRFESVRFDVRIQIEGKDPRSQTYAGVLHVGSGGATTQEDVTAHREAGEGTADYRRLVVGDDDYLSHSGLTLPPGKEFTSMGLNDAPWVGPYARDLSMATQDYHPGNLFGDLDRDTIRLVEHEDDRYVFSAGGVPYSGGYTKGDVRLVVEVDDENRPVRIEQTAPSFGKQLERRTVVYSQWGTAPDVLRPPQEKVAKPKDVVARRR